jgi:hypothetical protein
MRHIEISLMKEGELSIDGQTKPGGNIEIREFEDGEWTGGCYATYDNLVEKVKESLEEDVLEAVLRRGVKCNE